MGVSRQPETPDFLWAITDNNHNNLWFNLKNYLICVAPLGIATVMIGHFSCFNLLPVNELFAWDQMLVMAFWQKSEDICILNQLLNALDGKKN